MPVHVYIHKTCWDQHLFLNVKQDVLPISSAYTHSIFSVSNTKQEIGCHMIKVKCGVTSIKKYIQISVFMVLIEMTDLNIDIQIENEKKPIPQTPSNIGTTVR